MNPDTMNQLMRDASEVKRLLRLMSSRTDDAAHEAEVKAVWRTVRTVCAAALVEHLRIVGTDVSDLERQLVEHGDAPWRDLIVPVEQPTPDEPAAKKRDISIAVTLRIGAGETHE